METGNTKMKKDQEKKNQNSNNNNNNSNKQPAPLQLTFEQLRDVQDSLRRPLSGRCVLIPLGPKAFVPGQLRPHHHLSGERQQEDSSSSKGNVDGNNKDSSSSAAADFKSSTEPPPVTTTTSTTSEGEEHVWFKNHLDGSLQQMTRQQAMQHVQEEMNLLVQRGKKAKPRPQQQQQKSILKSKKNKQSTIIAATASAAAATNNNSNNNNNTASSSNKGQEDNASCLPFIEIREEYDETGQRVIWSEAIDVTKRLELLEQQVRAGGDAAVVAAAGSSEFDGDDDDVDINKRHNNAREESPRYFSVKEEVEETPNSENNTNNNIKQQVSDQEYNILSSRLEELARLEEEAEISKKINQTSSKKLQSKGWSKGFLNSKKKVAVAKPKPPAPKETATHDTPPATAPLAETARGDKKKVVGFHEETTVKEIPRVGERSVQDIQKTKQQQPVVPPSRPLEESVFSGVIRERRPTAVARRSRGTASSQTLNNSTSAAQQTTTSSSFSSQPKKVSRFVQQRRQLG